MKQTDKQTRHQKIASAAYTVLAEHGYGGASMLKIAKAAKASNETMYRWYGDKKGLFTALVRDNAAETKALLENAISKQSDPSDTLRAVSPVFLSMLLSDKAVALNRAAAADPSNELGQAISSAGRDVIQPLLTKILQDLAAPSAQKPDTFTSLYLGLLVGDLQIKRAIGVSPAPSAQEIEDRCNFAIDQITQFAKRL